MLFYFKKNKNPNASPRLQLTNLNKELYSLRNNSIDFAEKWRNSFIKFTSKIQTTGSSASFWAENENDKVLYESLNEISIYLTDFETQSKSWLSCQKNWIELLKELSENETKYIDKEKEYFKILSKLHDITSQIRNFDQESQDIDDKDREKSKEEDQGERNNPNNKEQLQKQESKKMKSSLLSLGRKEKKKDPSNNKKEGGENDDNEDENENEIDKAIKEMEEMINEEEKIKEENQNNKNNKNKDSNNNSNKNDKKNENSGIGTSNSTSDINNNNNNNNNNKYKMVRTKNSYPHLVHIQNKLKKEFLKYFNDNQKQLDTIYLIKELKIPTTLYKLIQESSKMWNQYMKTYSKLEESLSKLKIYENLEDPTESKKNSIEKLNLNFDNQEEVVERMNKEAEYVKKISPVKTQLENIKSWMKNSEKWIKLLEETFNYQKSHIQFVSKWLHEAYKNHIFEKQISMLKLKDIVHNHPNSTKTNTHTNSNTEGEKEDTEFIRTIINIYNNRVSKSNSKYYNILYKTSLADKKRDEFLKNCEWKKGIIGNVNNSDKEEEIDDYEDDDKDNKQNSSYHKKNGKGKDDHSHGHNHYLEHLKESSSSSEQERQDSHTHDLDQMMFTQKNKYSSRHIHLSYVYLFQSFGELTTTLEENILSQVGQLNPIYSQIIHRYDDLKKQNHTVSKIINDIKKNTIAYHDEKLFHVIKSKKKQWQQLKRLSHDYDIQKYKLNSLMNEFDEFKRMEISNEYSKILDSVKGSSIEYIELCDNILEEYDQLNSKKEHKEKEMMTKKLMQLMGKHEKLESKNNINENNKNSNSNKKSLSHYDAKTKMKTKSINGSSNKKVEEMKDEIEKDNKLHKLKGQEKVKEENQKEQNENGKEKEKENIVESQSLEPNKTSEEIQQPKRTRVGSRRSRIFSHNTINKKNSNSSNSNSTIGIITNTSTTISTNTAMKTSHGKKKKNENEILKEKENKNKSIKEKVKKTEKEKDKKLEDDIISMIESNETLDHYDLTSKRINDYHQTPMVYTNEEPVTEENMDGEKDMLHNLPNMVNEVVPVSPKGSIRKRNNSKASSIKSKYEDYDHNYNGYPTRYNNNNKMGHDNYEKDFHHYHYKSRTNSTNSTLYNRSMDPLITTTTRNTKKENEKSKNKKSSILLDMSIIPPPSSPPPKYSYSSPNNQNYGMINYYYPGSSPSMITSEFPNFIISNNNNNNNNNNNIDINKNDFALPFEPLLPGSYISHDSNNGSTNLQPSAPPMDSLMFNLKPKMNVV